MDHRRREAEEEEARSNHQFITGADQALETGMSSELGEPVLSVPQLHDVEELSL